MVALVGENFAVEMEKKVVVLIFVQVHNQSNRTC